MWLVLLLDQVLHRLSLMIMQKNFAMRNCRSMKDRLKID